MKIAKATKPATAILKVLETTKANLKVEKLPPAYAVANPLEDSIATVTDALEQLKDTYSDATAKKLIEEVEKAKHIAKSMKTFT